MASTGVSVIDTLRDSLRTLFSPKAPEPSYPALPALSEHMESSIPGVYFAGDLAGAVLIKTALNQGYDLVEHIAGELERERRERVEQGGAGDVYDLVIVGSGAAGFAATLRAHQRGLRYVTLEAARFAESIQSMTKGKLLFAEPTALPLKGDVWFEECTREEMLERWEQERRKEGLRIRTGERVVDIRTAPVEAGGPGKNGILTVETERGRYTARRVILAMGKSGNPRKAGAAGEQEHAAKIAHRLADPEEFRGRRILIYGGGDVAAEAALALAGHNDVTLATIDQELVFPRKRNVDALREKERAGRLRILLNTRLAALHADRVEVEADGRRESLANDFVFEMIGADLPVKFLRKIGVRLQGEWTPKRWALLAGLMVSVYTFFALKGPRWPFNRFSPERYRELFYLFDQAPSFWYTVLFTVLVVAFGIQARRRWGRDDPYQRWRFASFISFQVGFFLLVQVALARLIPQYYWRGWGLWQPFPLFYNTFFWWYPSDPAYIKWFFIGMGLLLTFVVIPLFVRRHGMRFCTWVCGCGALAETLGDRWRHFSPKGHRSRLWEFQGPLVLAWAFLSLAVIVLAHQTQGNTAWWRWYDYLVDFWLVGVIPIGVYPFFGGKVWCRYWCPLAHYMKFLSAWFGRLEIRANDKCIQCGECSKHCMVGVDVMSFARNGQPFDNRTTSCVHCGICVTVCPVDVLSFGLKPERTAPLVQIASAGARANLAG